MTTTGLALDSPNLHDDRASPEQELDTTPAPRHAASLGWLVYLVLGAAAITTYYFLPRAGVGQAVLLTVLNATAAGLAYRGASKTHGRARVVWASLAISMTFATLANGPYYGVPLITGHPTPFPYPGDILFLATYPCYMIALGALAGQRRRNDRRGDALDSMILVIAGGSLMWEFVIAPVVHASGLPILAHVVSLAYPTMDLIVFAMLIRLVVAVSWRSGSMRLLLGSFVFLLVSDTLYATQLAAGTYQFGGPTDALWMASYLFIGMAALHPSAREFTRAGTPSGHRLSKGKLAFLGGSLLTGPVLLANRPHELFVIACASGVSFLLVMARVTGLNRQLVLASVEIESRASTDSLTGLANRAVFHGQLAAVLAQPSRRGLTQAVLFVDLDDFKDVNDTLGHAAGDSVLRAVADRLHQAVRPGDLIARLGGDEFALLLDAVPDLGTAQLVAERVVHVLAAPVDINGSVVHVGASVGLALRHDGSDPDKLMREADVAMYTAKGNGKNRVACYDSAVDTAVGAQHELKADLLLACGRDEFVLDYQPLYDLETGGMVGVEALVRWQHPVRGLLPPYDFIGLAEESGAIVDIGAWVLETACRQVHTWQRLHALPQFDLCVNISMRQLERSDFADQVKDVLLRTEFDPACLVLEITESVLADPRSESAARLTTLRRLGIRVAIDDFGTGYSSIEYLRRLPVDILKIDRSFVSAEHPGPHDEALLDAIVGLGQRLGLDVIPEGIEEADQLIRVQDLGCRTGQGFLLSRPVSPAAIEMLLGQTSTVPSPRRPGRHRDTQAA
ncbi:MAG: diguanylate cyclase [Frankiales bacterium]|jgi:diguanylate cyclase (GGDEF)-like protein|nr:diguanylate cyclase [Frankiales bacterium]